MLMEPDKKGEVTLDKFTVYLNLIMAAIRKVHSCKNDENLLSDKEIKLLFNKISNGKNCFDYNDFEKVYSDKPELLSWVDYFKNNDEEALLVINDNLRLLLTMMRRFFLRFSNILQDTLTNASNQNGEAFLKDAMNEISTFCKTIQKTRNKFNNMDGVFNLRSVLENLTKSFNDTKLNPNIMSTLPFKKESRKGKTLDNIIPTTSLKESAKKLHNITQYRFIEDQSDGNDNVYFDVKSMENYPLENEISDSSIFKKFDTRILRKQFNFIKNKIISDSSNKIIEEDLFDDNEEDPNYEKDRVINMGMKEMNINIGMDLKNPRTKIADFAPQKVFKSVNNNEKDASKKIDMIPSDHRINLKFSKNEVIIYDTSLVNNEVEAEDVKIEFAENGKEEINQNDHINSIINESEFSALLERPTKMPMRSLEKRDNTIKTFSNGGNIKTFNIPNENINQIGNDGKQKISNNYFENHNETFNQFLKKLKTFSDYSYSMTEWIEESYKWVESRYLKSRIIKTKKEKKSKEIDLRFSMQNIPKPKDRGKKKKVENKKTLLKTADHSFKILMNMIMGIQIATQSTPNVTIYSESELKNYLNSLTYSIQTYNFGTRKQESYYIKEYAPVIFNNIRKLYNIDKETYTSSISPQDLITELMISSSTIIEELCSTGKSGSLFYYTRDGKLILKTISYNEYMFLKKILPNYYLYIKKNPNSFLPKFLGSYKLVRKVKKSKKRIYFLIMMNIFSTNKEIHYRYDLKGSKVGREVLNKMKLKPGEKITFALKDLDMEKLGQYILIGDKKQNILNQLKKDSEFLADNNIVDYSLLIGIHSNHIEYNNANFKIPLEIQPKIKIKLSSNSHNENFADGFKQNPLQRRKMMTEEDYLNNYKEFRSVLDKKTSALKLEEEERINETDNSIYNMSINHYNESQMDHFHIQKNNQNNPYRDFEDGGIRSYTNDEIYYMGIIDILTEFNTFKKIEYVCKAIGYCSNKMSSVPPNSYKNRFNSYIETRFINEEGDKNQNGLHN